jgi:hypothetical protein
LLTVLPCPSAETSTRIAGIGTTHAATAQ